LKPVISRNDVKRDNNFEEALQIIRGEVQNFQEKVFSYLVDYANYARKGREIGNLFRGVDIGELYRYLATIFRRALQPKSYNAKMRGVWEKIKSDFSPGMISSRIFYSIHGELYSIADLVNRVKNKPLFVARKRSRITERFKAEDSVIMIENESIFELLDQINRMGKFRGPIDVNKKFYTPPIKDKKGWKEQKFVDLLKSLEDDFSGAKIILGHYDEDEGLGDNKEIYIVRCNRYYLDRSPSEIPLRKRNLVILNINRKEIRNLVELSVIKPQTAKKMTGLKIASFLEKDLKQKFLEKLESSQVFGP
jgi:hypothetical protein